MHKTNITPMFAKPLDLNILNMNNLSPRDTHD